jgi:hypothetical protein
MPSATSHYIRCVRLDQLFKSADLDLIEDARSAVPTKYLVHRSKPAIKLTFKYQSIRDSIGKEPARNHAAFRQV